VPFWNFFSKTRSARSTPCLCPPPPRTFFLIPHHVNVPPLPSWIWVFFFVFFFLSTFFCSHRSLAFYLCLFGLLIALQNYPRSCVCSFTRPHFPCLSHLFVPFRYPRVFYFLFSGLFVFQIFSPCQSASCPMGSSGSHSCWGTPLTLLAPLPQEPALKCFFFFLTFRYDVCPFPSLIQTTNAWALQPMPVFVFFGLPSPFRYTCVFPLLFCLFLTFRAFVFLLIFGLFPPPRFFSSRPVFFYGNFFSFLFSPRPFSTNQLVRPSRGWRVFRISCVSILDCIGLFVPLGPSPPLTSFFPLASPWFPPIRLFFSSSKGSVLGFDVLVLSFSGFGDV